jgi:hypothetical protein
VELKGNALADEGWIHIDGKHYSPEDLTFREQREMRRIYRELIENPTADLDEAAFMDLLPALTVVLKRREDSSYTVEQALDIKAKDLLPPGDAPPTKRAAAKK